MKDSFVEQEAFSENKFQVGDRVRVYAQDPLYKKGTSYTGIVQKSEEDSVWFWNERTGNGEYKDIFHFKQCRLLKRRERRVWWILERKDGPDLCRPIPPTKFDEGTWIKVQEVF